MDSSSSPCPSPLPIFQQLSHAVAFWERILTDSPDNTRKYSLDNNLGLKFGSLDDPDGTDDEHSNNNTPKIDKMKKRFSVNFSEISEDNKIHKRRKSSPADLTSSEDKNKKQSFIKIRIVDDNS